MFCTNCGKSLQEGTAFCPSCGASMNPDAGMGQPFDAKQEPNQAYGQPPAPQPPQKDSKTPIIVAIVVVVIVAIVVGAGFATNWFGLVKPDASTTAVSGSSASPTNSQENSEAASAGSESAAATPSPQGSSSAASPSTSGLPNSAAVTKKLVVGFDDGFPPYGYQDENGKYVGIDLDLAREVCKRNGWDFNAVPIDWDKKETLLESGEINCIWNGLTYTADREDAYTLSEPYIKQEINYPDEGIVTETYVVAFKRGDAETAKIVSDTLREMYKDGTVESILEKYQSESSVSIDDWVLK